MTMYKTWMGLIAMALASASVIESEAKEPVMRPGKCLQYTYENDDWSLFQTSDYTYDSKGNILTENNDFGEFGFSKLQNTYDSFGMKTSALWTRKSVGNTVTSLEEIAYDPIVHTFAISDQVTMLENDAWVPYHSKTSTVTRNDDGNVTEVVYVLTQGEETTERIRMVVAYGSDGKATEITIQQDNAPANDIPEWSVPVLALKNIVWHVTDGQIMGRESVYEIIDGDSHTNRLLSADVCDSDKEAVHYVFQYGGDTPEDFVRECQVMRDGQLVTIEKVRKEYGDYGSWNKATYSFEGPDGISDTPVETKIAKRVYDSHGNMINRSDIEYTGFEYITPTYVEILNYENIYDDEGCLIERTANVQHLDSDGNLPDAKLTTKYVYSDYKDVSDSSGVISIETDDLDAPVIYFDLQGVPVKNPGHGLYIRKQGSRANKIRL